MGIVKWLVIGAVAAVSVGFMWYVAKKYSK